MSYVGTEIVRRGDMYRGKSYVTQFDMYTPGVKFVQSPIVCRVHNMLTPLVHAFIASRVDYCNTVLAGSPKTITDRIQRVLNVAARVVSGTRKFDRGLSKLLHSELHWLDIPQRVQYKLGVIVLLST